MYVYLVTHKLFLQGHYLYNHTYVYTCMHAMLVYMYGGMYMYSFVVSEEQNLCISTYPFVFREEMKSVNVYVCIGFAFIEELGRQMLIPKNCELKGFPPTPFAVY